MPILESPRESRRVSHQRQNDVKSDSIERHPSYCSNECTEFKQWKSSNGSYLFTSSFFPVF
eukprot:scaffold30636_cov100-Cyclotella_meneghiniana.AAC.7